jgi:hypothetical protein
MRDRDQIRATVWGEQSLESRFGQLLMTATNFELFDVGNVDHLALLDMRLNQDLLVGAAVTRLSHTGKFADGQTLIDALLSVIPRAIWPDKPMKAGSGNVVSEYTGMQFAEGTSVGVGQVLEFYINFGTAGVVFCFIMMGAVITWIDFSAAQRLAECDLRGFVLWYLPGISFLQVGGSMVEVASSAAASLVLAWIVNVYLKHAQQRTLSLPPRGFALDRST